MANEDGDGRRDPASGEILTDGERLEALVTVLVLGLDELRQHLERPAVRRAVHEAVRTWPGDPQDRWWKWLIEAGASLGLRVSLIEDRIDNVARWIDEGVQVVAYSGATSAGSDSGDEWVLANRGRGSKYVVRSSRSDWAPVVVRRRGLQRLLAPDRQSDSIRVVTLEPVLTCSGTRIDSSAEHKRPSPLVRFARIIRAEWSDIWVVLVFSLISGILSLATPMAVQVMVSFVAFGRFLQPVVVLSLMLLALMVFWAMLRLWETYVAEVLQRRLFARVVHDLSHRLPRLRYDALDGRYGPELANRFFDVVTLQKVTIQLLLDAVDLVMVGVIGMVVLAVYHPYLLGFDVILLILIGLLVFVLGKGGARTSIEESKYKYSTAAWLEEVARCPLTFKLDNAAEFAEERAEHLVSGYLEHRSRHFRVLFRQIAFALGMHAASGSVLLGIGGWLVINGQLTLGQLVAAEMIVAIIVRAFTKIGKHLEAFYDLMAGMDKLGVLLDLPLERQQGLMRLPETEPARLSLRKVDCRVGGRPVLHGVSFEVEPGERIALVGSSGSGKSVLADVLYGLREPESGQVLLDNHELLEVRPDVWRRHVMLLRPGELFHATITENVHLDHPDLDQRLVREACERLGLLDPDSLPEGLETVVGPTGAPLTGSRQRLLILARAIVHQPRLLLVDELLDALSGDELERAMEVLFESSAPWTLIVISARPEIVQRCDRIVSLAPAVDGPPPDELVLRR